MTKQADYQKFFDEHLGYLVHDVYKTRVFRTFMKRILAACDKADFTKDITYELRHAAYECAYAGEEDRIASLALEKAKILGIDTAEDEEGNDVFLDMLRTELKNYKLEPFVGSDEYDKFLS